MINLLPISGAARVLLSTFAERSTIWLGRTVCQLTSSKNPLLKITAVFSLIVLSAAVYFFRDSLFRQPLPKKEDEPAPAAQKIPQSPFSQSHVRIASPLTLASVNGSKVGEKGKEDESDPSSSSSFSSASSSSGVSLLSSEPIHSSMDLETDREMKESICEMEKLFDEAYHNLPLLGDELRREKFLKLYNQFNDINGAYFSAQKQSGDLFEKAFQINLDFTLLCSMYDTRFAHVKRAREQEKIDEKGKASQSMDGSCWLHTIINALPYLTFSEGIEYDVSSTASLREAVVNWMETHRENPELLEHLERAIFDHKEHMTDYAKAYIEELKMMHQSGDCSDEQFEENELRATTDISNLENFSLDDYFRLMREPNSFGSGAEFYALSQMLKINIRILVDNGTEVPESDRFPDLNYPGATQTAYVLMNPSGNHFDRYHPTEDVTISGLLDIRAAHDIPSPSASSSSSSSSS